MIPVTAKEQPRRFKVRVGEKLIGRVTVNGDNWIYCETVDENDCGVFHWLDSGFKSITTAANRILRHKGYGNAEGCTVKRVKGFRG